MLHNGTLILVNRFPPPSPLSLSFVSINFRLIFQAEEPSTSFPFKPWKFIHCRPSWRSSTGYIVSPSESDSVRTYPCINPLKEHNETENHWWKLVCACFAPYLFWRHCLLPVVINDATLLKFSRTLGYIFADMNSEATKNFYGGPGQILC